MRLVGLALIIAATLLVMLTTNTQSGPSFADAISAREALGLARRNVPTGINRVALQLTDWATYMKTFNKHYSSWQQMLVRQSLFMARVYEVFITTLKHYLRLTSYYTAINKYSDATPAEVELLTQGDADDSMEAEFVSDEELERFLANEDVQRIVGANDEGSKLSRRKRELNANFMDKDNDEDDDDDDVWSSKVPDIPAEKLDEIAEQAKREQSKLEAVASTLKPAGPVGRVQSIVSSAYEWLASVDQQQHRENVAKQVTVHKDWRETGCIGLPRDQGYCQSCYAFSSIAFAEWAYCRHREGQFTRLSPQYVINCASRLNPAEFNGCARGPIRLVPEFIREFGLELEQRLPYVEETEECPIKVDAREEGWGSIRPTVGQSIRLKKNTDKLDVAIASRPIILSMFTPKNFISYGGGFIDDCNNQRSSGHAVLIVGSMTEDGTDYLLVQNSLGAFWGLQGYFKIKRTPHFFDKCVKHFMLPTLKFSDS